MFLDDIVDDEVLPYLSLAVDGLTQTRSLGPEDLEMRPEDASGDDDASAGVVPEVAFDPEQLEIRGWESTLWRQLKRFVGF